MSPEKIDQLEGLIASAVEKLNGLYQENIRLTGRIRELEKEREATLKDNRKARETLERFKQLEVSHRKLEKDRSAVRVKVQNVLQKIEDMDFV